MQQADGDRLDAVGHRRQPVADRAARARRRRRRAGRRPRSAGRAARAARAGRPTGRRATAGPGGRSRSRRRARSVVTSATSAPRRSSSALVATVVPWARARRRLVGRHGRRRPPRTASPGSCRRRRHLGDRPSAATTSVNVPPVSTPTRGPPLAMTSADWSWLEDPRRPRPGGPGATGASRAQRRVVVAVPHEHRLVAPPAPARRRDGCRAAPAPAVESGGTARSSTTTSPRARRTARAKWRRVLLRPRPVGVGVRQHRDERHAGVDRRLRAELLGAEPQAGEHDEVVVQLAPWRRGSRRAGGARSAATGFGVPAAELRSGGARTPTSL